MIDPRFADLIKIFHNTGRWNCNLCIHLKSTYDVWERNNPDLVAEATATTPTTTLPPVQEIVTTPPPVVQEVITPQEPNLTQEDTVIVDAPPKDAE